MTELRVVAGGARWPKSARPARPSSFARPVCVGNVLFVDMSAARKLSPEDALLAKLDQILAAILALDTRIAGVERRLASIETDERRRPRGRPKG